MAFQITSWTIGVHFILCSFVLCLTREPAPLSIPPDQYWDGNDGKWSTFHFQIGTPPQIVRLLPSTQGSAVWTVLPEGCSSVDPSDCVKSRGEVYFTNRSSTWEQIGIYDLSLFEESLLGFDGAGLYGKETVALGMPSDGLSSLSSLSNQIIAGVKKKQFYLGILRLSPHPVYTTSLTLPIPSLLANLKNQSKIPSLSWGYTAGMFNRKPPVFGSLTMGGYDASRFQRNSLNISMGADISRDLLVSVQNITAAQQTLLSSPLFAFIDSLVTDMWLPLEVCTAFENAFNISWNATNNLYLVDEATHDLLLAQNPVVTLRIGSSGISDGVDIAMPYASFDMNISSEIVTSPTRYFPLKQAANDTQYTLGRVFLQNAYVIANYEYHNFSVSQAKYPDTSVPQSIVRIEARDQSRTDYGLKTRHIVGIVLGTLAAVTAGLAVVLYWRRRNNMPLSPKEPDPPPAPVQLQWSKPEADSSTIHEADGPPVGPHELEVWKAPVVSLLELPANEVAASEAPDHGLRSNLRRAVLPQSQRWTKRPPLGSTHTEHKQ